MQSPRSVERSKGGSWRAAGSELQRASLGITPHCCPGGSAPSAAAIGGPVEVTVDTSQLSAAILNSLAANNL